VTSRAYNKGTAASKHHCRPFGNKIPLSEGIRPSAAAVVMLAVVAAASRRLRLAGLAGSGGPNGDTGIQQTPRKG